MKKEIKKYIEFLEKNDVSVECCKDGSVELESYTDAGGDMTIYLDELTPKALKEYLDDFDIDEEVAIWWPGGIKGNGVPFNNMREHYDDVAEWVMWMKKVADGMESGEMEEVEYNSPSDEVINFIHTYGASNLANAINYLAEREDKSITAELAMALREYAKDQLGY